MATEEKALTKQMQEAEGIRKRFAALLDKTNKENPRPNDVKALTDLLNGNTSLELWRGVASAGYVAELTIIGNAPTLAGLRECWKQRLQL